MSKRPKDAVSIQLRNLDGVDLEEDSDKEDGETSVKEILKARDKPKLKARDKPKRWWDTVFLVICAFAIFIDPLFSYIYVTDQRGELMCFVFDKKAVWIYFGLRIVIDVFYIIDVIICLCGMSKERKGKKLGVSCCKPKTEQKSTVTSWKQIIKIRSILPRILVSLPIPEVLIAVWFHYDTDPFHALFVIVPFQYVLRIFLIYGSNRWRPIKETTAGRWLKPLLDFLPFSLASHLFGALWYRIAVQRLLDCLDPHARISQDAAGWKCYYITTTHRCSIDNEDKKTFDFGIYLYALQSNTTGHSYNLPRRITQSFWWALRNLSSFGSNLQTSMNTWEILFSIMISISGMALFLVYLNARVKGLGATGEGLLSKMKCTPRHSTSVAEALEIARKASEEAKLANECHAATIEPGKKREANITDKINALEEKISLLTAALLGGPAALTATQNVALTAEQEEEVADPDVVVP